MTDWIFKILRGPEWTEAESSHGYAGSSADRQDGFIHFSTTDQLVGTADKHFADVDLCFLLAFETKSFARDNLKWERSRGGELFPHLYAPLDASLAKKIWKLERQPDGQFDLSAALEWTKAHD